MDFGLLTKDELQVFDVLQKNGPITKKAVEQRLGWTPSTTNRAIQALLGKKAITETGQEESSGGRRPALYDVRSGMRYLLGIHISYGTSYVVLSDIKLRILDSERLVLPLIWQSPEQVIESVAAAVNTVLERAKVAGTKVLGAGLGIIGPLNRDTGTMGTMMSYTEPVPDWSGVPIRDMLSKALGLPVVADNSCTAGALAEYLYGNGRGSKSVSYIVCEVGIISGQITGGRIVRRQDDREDGLSHISVNALGPYCSCGKRGCVLQYASTTAIRDAIRMRIRAGAPTLIPEKYMMGDFTFQEYEKAANLGDQTVIDELELAGYHMAHALSNYINLLTPDYLVLGGLLTNRFPYFYDSVLHMLTRYHGEGFLKKIRVQRGGSFGENTMALGAAAMYYEKLIGNPIMD